MKTTWFEGFEGEVNNRRKVGGETKMPGTVNDPGSDRRDRRVPHENDASATVAMPMTALGGRGCGGNPFRNSGYRVSASFA